MTNRELAKLYKVPLTLKERKPTTAKAELEELWEKTGDRVLELVLEIRSLDTNLCVSPGTRILTGDLRWVKASTIVKGDILVGFDEQLPEDNRRRLEYTDVESVTSIIKPRIKLYTERGELVTSRSHMWLAEQYSHFGRRWYPAEEIRIGATISYFCDPWEVDTSYEAGYIAGFLDGEGSVSLGRVVRFGQNRGNTLDRIIQMVTSRGFKLGFTDPSETFRQYCVGGFGFQGIRLLGSIRPERLLEKADITGCLINGRGFTKLKVVGRELLPEGEVIAIRTNSHTFIAEGCHSHNSNYVPNWKPSSDGCVHTTWGYTAPSGQLDSSRPNILNLSKWTATGQRFRRIIEAPRGFSFIEFDKARFHICTMGYCAEDPEYIRFGRLDSHSIFTSHIMPKEWGKPITMDLSDGEITERANWIKKRCKQVKAADPQHGVDIRQDLSKRVVLGNQLGLGPRKLHRQNRKYIESEDRAKDLQLMLAELFPKVTRFKDQIRDVAHGFDARNATRDLLRLKDRFGGPKFLILKEWGMIDYFFDVYNWRFSKRNRRWEKAWGTDSERSIAWPVQGIAFGNLKYEHREMEAKDYMQKYGFINTIHDSNVFLVLDRLCDSCFCDVGGIMSAPCPKLVNEATGPLGLMVGVEAAIGKNLAEWTEENKEGMKGVELRL
jgi:hypothetical protein